MKGHYDFWHQNSSSSATRDMLLGSGGMSALEREPAAWQSPRWAVPTPGLCRYLVARSCYPSAAI